MLALMKRMKVGSIRQGTPQLRDAAQSMVGDNVRHQTTSTCMLKYAGRQTAVALPAPSKPRADNPGPGGDGLCIRPSLLLLQCFSQVPARASRNRLVSLAR